MKFVLKISDLKQHAEGDLQYGNESTFIHMYGNFSALQR